MCGSSSATLNTYLCESQVFVTGVATCVYQTYIGADLITAEDSAEQLSLAVVCPTLPASTFTTYQDLLRFVVSRIAHGPIHLSFQYKQVSESPLFYHSHCGSITLYSYRDGRTGNHKVYETGNCQLDEEGSRASISY